VSGNERSRAQLKCPRLELRDGRGEILTRSRPGDKTPALRFGLCLSKFDQEQLCLMLGRAYQDPDRRPPPFHVYGTRQALSNLIPVCLPFSPRAFIDVEKAEGDGRDLVGATQHQAKLLLVELGEGIDRSECRRFLSPVSGSGVKISPRHRQLPIADFNCAAALIARHQRVPAAVRYNPSP